MSKKAAAQAVAIICSAYGQTKVEQEAFQRLAAIALEDYSDQVLVELVNPKSGIIAKSKFPPSIAELHTWCRERTREIDDQARAVELQRKQDEEVKRALESRREREEREKAEIRALLEETSRNPKAAENIVILKAIEYDIELPYEVAKARVMKIADKYFQHIDAMPDHFSIVAKAYPKAFEDGLAEIKRQHGVVDYKAKAQERYRYWDR